MPAIVPTGGLGGFTIMEANLGPGILGALLRTMSASAIAPTVTLSGFPAGTILTYTDRFGNQVQVATGDSGLVLSAPNLGALFSILESLMVVSSPGNQNFDLEIEVTSARNPREMQTITVPVIAANPSLAPVLQTPGTIFVDGGGVVDVPIQVAAPGATDDDDLCVELQVGRDSSGVLLGSLMLTPGVSVTGVSFSALGNGAYSVSSSLGTAGLREAAINMFLLRGLSFRSNGQSEGLFPQGITVTAAIKDGSGKSSI